MKLGLKHPSFRSSVESRGAGHHHHQPTMNISGCSRLSSEMEEDDTDQGSRLADDLPVQFSLGDTRSRGSSGDDTSSVQHPLLSRQQELQTQQILCPHGHLYPNQPTRPHTKVRRSSHGTVSTKKILPPTPRSFKESPSFNGISVLDEPDENDVVIGSCGRKSPQPLQDVIIDAVTQIKLETQPLDHPPPEQTCRTLSVTTVPVSQLKRSPVGPVLKGSQQVWPVTQFFSVSFCENSLICLEGKSMTPHRENTIFSSVPPSNSLVSVLDP